MACSGPSGSLKWWSGHPRTLSSIHLSRSFNGGGRRWLLEMMGTGPLVGPCSGRVDKVWNHTSRVSPRVCALRASILPILVSRLELTDPT
ncbi:hypothetical protein B0T20DRAFT_415180 [Sordaria brevicollis]|uniref:Uncharacterized protein n=1 Tax=Sordaria brevicollis TaxID=83679 RepID=A0AAE0UAP7_SORBR|nr:hypothetical protein B0T20DRAFT_415180 [Sordaria brevicollis]